VVSEEKGEAGHAAIVRHHRHIRLQFFLGRKWNAELVA
jgi:hypothetical protein